MNISVCQSVNNVQKQTHSFLSIISILSFEKLLLGAHSVPDAWRVLPTLEEQQPPRLCRKHCCVCVYVCNTNSHPDAVVQCRWIPRQHKEPEVCVCVCVISNDQISGNKWSSAAWMTHQTGRDSMCVFFYLSGCV